MQLKDIMTKAVETIDPGESLQAAAHKMDQLDTGFLPVVEAEMPIGVVTDRDIVIRGVALALDPKATKVREVMTMNMESLSEDADIEEAVQLMREKQIRRLVVRGHGDKIAGIVSLGDIALDSGDWRLSGETLEKVSETRGE
jgi:CBS domain-containing protein